tara:strand:- start:571 stop:1560 length:990 start_codon:yes stop_codon:yes gene_type:complete
LIKNFRALVTKQNKDGTFENIVEQKTTKELPEGDLLIRVEYSSLNYKDALAASGAKGITNTYPHTPGIDAAGVVEESNNIAFPPGTSVIVTGFDLGMNTSGGFSEYIRVPSEWAIKCPDNLTTKEAMMIGTAGLTAGLSTLSIVEDLIIENAKIIVSGATGGVGSIGVKLCSQLGAKVTAITGKVEETDFLKELGAIEVIDRNDFIDNTRLPLSKGIYDAAIDVVGGNILSSIIASMHYNGIITICGNVRSPKFETSVFPFILRGNSLIGIDSAKCNLEDRENVWNHFATNWKLNELDKICNTVDLDGVIPEIKKILKGEQTGRVLLQL